MKQYKVRDANGECIGVFDDLRTAITCYSNLVPPSIGDRVKNDTNPEKMRELEEALEEGKQVRVFSRLTESLPGYTFFREFKDARSIVRKDKEI